MRPHRPRPWRCALLFALLLLPSLAWPLNKDAKQAYKQGQRAVKSEVWNQARRHFEKSHQLEPSWSKPIEALIRLKLDRRIAPVGIKANIEQFSELKPESYKRWLFQARLAHQQGRSQTAIDMYSKALAKRPKTLTALLHRADLRMEIGNFKAALADYDSLLGLRANHKDARWGRLLALVALRRWEDAHASVLMLRTSFPNNGALLRLHQTISRQGGFPTPDVPTRPSTQYRELPPSSDAP